jgi:hypothetical protein
MDYSMVRIVPYFHKSITLNLKMKEKIKIQPTFDPLMDDDGRVTHELSLLASNIIKEVVARFLTHFLHS